MGSYLLALVLLTACDTKHEYPAEAKVRFVGTCQQGGETADYCECLYEAFRTAYTYEEFKQLDEQLGTGTIDGDVLQFIKEAQERCKD